MVPSIMIRPLSFLSVSPASHPCHTTFLFPAKDAGEETIFDKIVSGDIPSDKVRVVLSGWLVM